MTEEKNFDTYPCCANCVHYDPELETVDLLGMQLALGPQALGLAPQDAVARPTPTVSMRKGACCEAQTGPRHVGPGDRCGRHPFLAGMAAYLGSAQSSAAKVYLSHWGSYLTDAKRVQALVRGQKP